MKDTTSPWSSIIDHYGRSITADWAEPMFWLAVQLEDAGFVKAGLFGMLSMHELHLSQNRDVRSGPQLIVSPVSKHKISILYDPGYYQKVFELVVPAAELNDRVEYLLVKRLRWFKKN